MRKIETKLISLNVIHNHCRCERNPSDTENIDNVSVEIEVQEVEPESMDVADSSKQEIYTGQLSHLRVLDTPESRLWHPYL